MNVLLVIDGLWVGGTERSLAEMLPHMVKLGVRPTVACLRRCSEGVEDEVRADGIEVILLPQGGIPRQVLGLRRLLAERRPALVHSALYRSNLVTRLAAVGTGVPVLNSLVNDSYGRHRLADPAIRPWRLRVVRWVDAMTGRLLVDRFHAVSHTVAEAAGRDLGIPARRIAVVRRGRDPDRLGAPSPERRRAARAALGLGEDAEVVLNVGREDYQKGQDVLLEALDRLAPDRPRLHLLLVGRSGSLSPRIEERIRRLDAGGHVHRLGHRRDVPDLLAAADVFAFPSRFEGLPGAVVEALALGLPVVASDIPPVRELLPTADHGILVPPEDPDRLAEALESLLEDRERAEAMGRHNREAFLGHHTIRPRVDAMLDLYRTVVG